MKVGFSSICCPTWDLRTIFEHAVRLGVDGIELRGLQGELHLPNHPELAERGDVVVDVCRKTKVELVCLATSASFGFKKKQVLSDHQAAVREHIDLAARLHCPYVRVFTGDAPTGADRHKTLGRVAEALADLVHYASRRRVVLLIENSGDLSSSKDLWFLLDAVSHPALRACWNPVNGLSLGDRSSVAIPRLGSRLGLVHVVDAKFTGLTMEGYRPLGEGDIDVPLLLEWLTGIAYDGYLMLDWPKLWDPALTDPEKFLPMAVKYLRELLSIERKPLAAYKGDKNAPKLVSRSNKVAARG